MPLCISCSEETTKYKCPICRSHYCSVNCYKIHKEKPCEAPVIKQDTFVEDKNRNIELFTTLDTVKPALLEKLQDCERLKNLLYNPHLRKYLMEVDSAHNASKAMQAAMLEPLFIEFADECLKVVEPREMDEYECTT